MFHELRTLLQRNRDLFTLLWLIAIILAIPYLDESRLGVLILVLLITGLLLSALYSVSDRPTQVAVGFLLCIPTLLCSWTYMVVPSMEIWIALVISLIVFLVYILSVVLRRVVKAREVTLVELFRAVIIYMMIGLAFGLLYLILEILVPHSFHFSSGIHDPESLIYFSFVALSTSGFGDITAVAPIARSLVTIELLIGVMYMAVLIGFLVNAHYSAKYSKPRGEWREEGTGPIMRFRVPFLSSGGPLTILAIAVMLNMASSMVMVVFGVPLFLDTWGTSFAVIMSGFPVGALAGVLYNLLMAFTIWEPTSLMFAGSSVLVAALTYIFWRRGWVDVRRPGNLIAAGALTGLVNALFTFSLTIALGLPSYEGILDFFRLVQNLSGNSWVAHLLVNLVVEVIDKTFCIVLAAIAAVFFTNYFKRESEGGGREERTQ
ncbi:MAG: ion channel [Methanolinea sp.]|nr:ion channel [Methanolinea sp.]